MLAHRLPQLQVAGATRSARSKPETSYTTNFSINATLSASSLLHAVPRQTSRPPSSTRRSVQHLSQKNTSHCWHGSHSSACVSSYSIARSRDEATTSTRTSEKGRDYIYTTSIRRQTDAATSFSGSVQPIRHAANPVPRLSAQLPTSLQYWV